MNPRFLQRLKSPTGDNPFAFGGGLKNGGIEPSLYEKLSDVFSFDYMGAFEYEHGATAVAIEALKKSNLVTFCINDVVWGFCPRQIITDVVEWIRKAINGDVKTKDKLYLVEQLQDPEYSIRIKGWLNIETRDECEHPFMFFIDQEMFNKTLNLFKHDA